MSDVVVKDIPIEGKSPSLALVMMVKNEQKRIRVSLDSVKDIVDCFVILDTGSEDNTIDIIKKYCKKNNKLLFLEQKVFPQPFNFSTARNHLLDYADDKADYLLLLDCNDELKGGDDLKKFIQVYNGSASAFHICQEWWNGISLDKYYNIRLVRSKHQWRYKGAIHEYMSSPEEDKIKYSANPQDTVVSRVVGITLYQDRTKDDDKSFKRFIKDEQILDAEYQEILDKIEEDKTVKPDCRNLFYYAQTCICLGKKEKAYNLYKQRSEQTHGFTEERYHSYYRCGEISQMLSHDWEESMLWYLKAYEYSCHVFSSPRAEPLYKIADYYKDKCWDICFMYLRRCCELVYPESAILFVDRRVYDYLRWHLMGIVAYYVNNMEMGKIACENAIKSENRDIDKNNLMHYLDEREKLKIKLKAKLKEKKRT